MEFEDFVRYARQGTLVAVERELSADTLTPVTAFLRLRRDDEPAFLFESVEGGERIGRYSFLGRDPFQRIAGTDDQVTIDRPDGTETRRGNFFDVLDEVLASYRSVDVPGLPPLTGGAVGYIGYDAVRWIERLPDRHPRETDLPDAELYFYDTLVAFDHAKHRLVLIANAHVPESADDSGLRAAYDDAQRRLDQLEEALCQPAPGEGWIRSLSPLAPDGGIASGMDSNMSKDEFEEAVRKAREYIFAGDIFQVVLSQRFQRAVSVDPFEIYRCLRTLNPSPYLSFVQRPETAVFGSSPEIMVRVEDGRAVVRPIAGTRRRGKDPEEDLALERELLADEKERAEHLMLIDLGRNDVGRVSDGGSVRMTERFAVERYSRVMHIVSE
ncbi:MAG: chorismate-binding protein, partial [Planctomycetota bacterium]